MTIAIYLITILINSFYAIKKEKSKILLLVSLIIIVLLVGGAGPNYFTPNHSKDYTRYVSLYDKSVAMSLFSDLQIGYISLMKLSHLINLDFMSLRIIVIKLCYLLLYIFVIKKYSFNPHFIILMYLLTPMIVDSDQFRNFIAMTFLLIGLTQLVKETGKAKVLFLLFVLVAASFHTAFLIYTILIFANTKEQNKPAVMIAGAAILLFVATLLNGSRLPFLNSLAITFGDERILGYLTSKTNLGYIVPMLLHGMSIGLLYWSKKILHKTIGTNSERDPDVKIFGTLVKQNPELVLKTTNLVFWINVLGIAFSPLFILHVQFYRLIRNFMILNYIIYSYAAYRIEGTRIYKLAFYGSIILSGIIWFVLDNTIIVTPDMLLYPFFTQNFFFN